MWTEDAILAASRTLLLKNIFRDKNKFWRQIFSFFVVNPSFLASCTYAFKYLCCHSFFLFNISIFKHRCVSVLCVFGFLCIIEFSIYDLATHRVELTSCSYLCSLHSIFSFIQGYLNQKLLCEKFSKKNCQMSHPEEWKSLKNVMTESIWGLKYKGFRELQDDMNTCTGIIKEVLLSITEI